MRGRCNGIKQKTLDLLRDAGVILVSGFLYALAFNWLFQPNQIVTGGFTGIGQVIHRLIPLVPVGVVSIVLNVPLFLLLARRLGIASVLKSFCAMFAGSVMIDLIASVHTFPPMENKFLACVYAGVLFGLTIGFQMRIGVTTGGSDLAARLLKYRYRHISIGRLCLAIDLVIIVLYALVFRSVDGALYGIIAMYVSSVTMDAVVYGSNHARMAVIVSDKNEELVKTLLERHFGITRIDGRGAYAARGKEVLLTTFHPEQITALKRTVLAIDPAAFIIICDANEVIGEGFGSYSEDSL